MDFLRSGPDNFVGRREIARKALKRTVFDEDPHWADAPLTSLVDRNLLEQNESGHYRIKRLEG